MSLIIKREKCSKIFSYSHHHDCMHLKKKKFQIKVFLCLCIYSKWFCAFCMKICRGELNGAKNLLYKLVRTETSGMCSTQKKSCWWHWEFFYVVHFVSQHWKITYKNTLENYFVNSMKNVGKHLEEVSKFHKLTSMEYLINVGVLVFIFFIHINSIIKWWFCVCWRKLEIWKKNC